MSGLRPRHKSLLRRSIFSLPLFLLSFSAVGSSKSKVYAQTTTTSKKGNDLEQLGFYNPKDTGGSWLTVSFRSLFSRKERKVVQFLQLALFTGERTNLDTEPNAYSIDLEWCSSRRTFQCRDFSKLGSVNLDLRRVPRLLLFPVVQPAMSQLVRRGISAASKFGRRERVA